MPPSTIPSAPNQRRALRRVLGIETSCDDTGLAVFDAEQGLLGHRLFSQIDLHRNYGGVVPELASRDHVRKAMPLAQALLTELGLKPSDLDGIAYTAGPGLAGALLVGAAFGRSLGFALGIPTLGVHHMEGHLLAPMLEPHAPAFPFLALLVSGGHTLLVRVEGLGQYAILGESIDDAVGEAFDKTAKLLGLGYPGGPAIERVARQGRPGRFEFPRPLLNRPGLDFSFSGLKTHALVTIQRATLDPQTIADIAWAFQAAAVDTLVRKCERALKETGLRTLVVAGGVGANAELRARLQQLGGELGAAVFYPRPALCTDNGAMIAYAGFLRLRAGQRDGAGFGARARWPLDTLVEPAAP